MRKSSLTGLVKSFFTDRNQQKDSRQFIRVQAFFDRRKDGTLGTSKFAGAKRASSKNTYTNSLLDLFCFEASLSIFSNTRLERAMLTGCLCTVA